MPVTPRLLLDVAIAIAAAAALVAERVIAGATSPLAFALALAIGASLAGRRRWPLAAYAIGSAGLVAESMLTGPSTLSPYANLIGLVSLGIYGTRAHALWGPAILVPGVVAYVFATGQTGGVLAASVLFVWLAGWALGYQSARGREQQEAVRVAQRGEAMADERVRIARELHDIVGHTVNLMLVQSGATRLVMDSDPAKAKELLVGVERAGREALGELDHLLGLLHDDESGEALPGVDRLPALAARLADAGLRVELEVNTEKLPRQVDVVVYRIVQEALTNALRHGTASTAVVRVTGAPHLHVEVRDNGHSLPSYEPGRGLRGMAERAALFGGTVEHHSTAEGFIVRARLEVP